MDAERFLDCAGVLAHLAPYRASTLPLRCATSPTHQPPGGPPGYPLRVRLVWATKWGPTSGLNKLENKDELYMNEGS